MGALAITAVLFFVLWIGNHNSAHELRITSPAVVILFVAIFGFFYFSQALFGRYRFLFGERPISPTAFQEPMICERCHTPQFDTGSHACSCGGSLEPLDHWRWTDEEHLPPPIMST
jgi:hypothetical protein